MQLILNTDADIGIRSNMSVIEQESLSLDTKIINNDVTDEIKSDISDVTEVNVISNDKENLKDVDVLENVGSVVNGKKDIENNENDNSTDIDSNQEQSENLNLLSNHEADKVEDSVDSNKENENFTDGQCNLNTSENFSEEKEDHLRNKIDTNEIEIKNDKKEMCNEIEEDLIKSQNVEINSNIINEMNEPKESDSNTTGEKIKQNLISESPLESMELNSSSNECDPEQKEIKVNNDTGKPHEIEMLTETSEEKSKSETSEEKRSHADFTETEFTMRVKNVNEINEKVLEKCTNKNEEDREIETIVLGIIENVHDNRIDSPIQIETQSESENDKIFDLEEEIIDKSNIYTSSCGKNDEVIDILDEKDDECVTVVDDKVCDVEKESKETGNIAISEKSTCNENDVPKIDIENTEKELNSNKNYDELSNNESLKDDMSNNLSSFKLNEEYKELENQTSNKNVTEASSVINNMKEKKPLLHISKLSNTLDILSDDDEEEQEPKEVPENKESDEKQCISVEDDDDIMLIDEETSDNKNDNLDLSETNMPQNEETKDQTTTIDTDVTMDVDESSEELPQESKVDLVTEKEIEIKDEQLDEITEHTEQKPASPKPLLPLNLLKSSKKNVAEMTREELEEFCVLKIVESVVDRSNLSEMNQQLKAMSQNIEDYKKKTNTLLKQNRDLQVVLKSIQEEQKKNTGQAITPLKITRSVGMQVLMIETPVTRKRPMPSSKFPTNSPNAAKFKNQSPKTPKGPTNSTNNQQIPVPRLVPAVNNAAINNKQQSPAATKVQVPNGLRSSPPAIKPEKRSFNKMQQGNSITVDLTDDEPPSKVVPRNIAPPVRLVPQQSLLTSQRPQFVNTVNSPRKVYIPISGSQNPVRPGQTIMLKQVSPQVPRIRGPSVAQKCNSVRLPRIAPKHPAPLPDSMKQYQPPNWKALPPSPELKLSKVENGIVISWKIDGYQEENHEEIASYQLYAYQETSSPPSTSLWKKIGDVKALPLPMACTLTQFMAGYKYYFAVRAVDVRSRLGPFSLPGSILLLNKM